MRKTRDMPLCGKLGSCRYAVKGLRRGPDPEGRQATAAGGTGQSADETPGTNLIGRASAGTFGLLTEDIVSCRGYDGLIGRSPMRPGIGQAGGTSQYICPERAAEPAGPHGR